MVTEYCKQWKAERGFGTRLGLLSQYRSSFSASVYVLLKKMGGLGVTLTKLCNASQQRYHSVDIIVLTYKPGRPPFMLQLTNATAEQKGHKRNAAI